MSGQRASLLIPAPRERIRGLLLDPLYMPAWNPAFRSLEGPRIPSTGTRYALKTIPSMSGSFWYTEIAEDRIDMKWTVPGFIEHGSWQFQDGGSETLTTHEFDHSGPLAALLRTAFRGVVDLRLARLAKRASTRA